MIFLLCIKSTGLENKLTFIIDTNKGKNLYVWMKKKWEELQYFNTFKLVLHFFKYISIFKVKTTKVLKHIV